MHRHGVGGVRLKVYKRGDGGRSRKLYRAQLVAAAFVAGLDPAAVLLVEFGVKAGIGPFELDKIGENNRVSGYAIGVGARLLGDVPEADRDLGMHIVGVVAAGDGQGVGVLFLVVVV